MGGAPRAALAVAVALPAAAHVGRADGRRRVGRPGEPEAQGSARNMVAVGGQQHRRARLQRRRVGARAVRLRRLVGLLRLRRRAPSSASARRPTSRAWRCSTRATRPSRAWSPRTCRPARHLGRGRRGLHRAVRPARRARHRRGRHPGLRRRSRPTRASSAACRSSTSPTRRGPSELALLSTGCCARGLHELEVQHRADLGAASSTRACRRPSTPTPARRAAAATTRARATSA